MHILSTRVMPLEFPSDCLFEKPLVPIDISFQTSCIWKKNLLKVIFLPHAFVLLMLQPNFVPLKLLNEDEFLHL